MRARWCVAWVAMAVMATATACSSGGSAGTAATTSMSSPLAANTATTPAPASATGQTAEGSSGVAAPSGKVWIDTEKGSTLVPGLPEMTSLLRLSSSGAGVLGLGADGQVWAIMMDRPTGTAAVSKVGLSGIRKISVSGETGDPTWYAVGIDGKVTQGWGDTEGKGTAPSVTGSLSLPFSDVVDVATERGPWLLRSDGTVWLVSIPEDGHSGTSTAGPGGPSPQGAQAIPVQGLTGVTHLWSGVGQDRPIAETKDGKLVELDRQSSQAPTATAIQGPEAPVAQLVAMNDTWVALDSQHHLWFWEAGADDNHQSLAGRTPKQLVGPTAPDPLVTDGESLYAADNSVWGLAKDSNSDAITVKSLAGPPTDPTIARQHLLAVVRAGAGSSLAIVQG